MTYISAVSEAELKILYQWVDQIPLSRPKRNIARDFADGGARAALEPGLVARVVVRARRDRARFVRTRAPRQKSPVPARN